MPHPNDEERIALESLIAEALGACEDCASGQREAVLDAYVARHPEHANALRRQFDKLAKLGLLASPRSTPATLGPYEILRELGSGGMGRVYLGLQHVPVRRLAAIKVLRAEAARGSSFARFEMERRTLAAMNHDGIARVFEVGTEGDVPWLAMEYVDGEPITRALDACRATIDARLRTFLIVLHAVHHAHQNGVLHRDLKPTNILCLADDRGLHPKVIDFGLARALEPDAGGAPLTLAGGFVGTPEYMSPEQFLHAETVDVRTDVYALGVCLHEILTGDLPIASGELRSGDLEQTLRVVRDTRPLCLLASLPATPAERAARAAERSTTAATLVRRLGAELTWIVAKALEKARDDRYDSVAAFARDLERHLRNEPVDAGPRTTWYHARTFLRRHRTSVSVAIAFLLVLIAGLIATWLAYREAEHERLVTRRYALNRRLETRIADARLDLWPPTPERIPAFESWLEEMEAYVTERPRHAAALHEDAPTMDAEPSEDRGLVDAADRVSDMREILDLLAHLDHLQEPDDPEDPESYGTIASVRARLRFARALERVTLRDHEALWEHAIASIADRDRCPRYDGLRIEAQLGMIPLGLDERSGLWEFRLVQMGGDAPIWNETNGARIEATSDLVLVLLPGGTVELGSQDEHPDQPNFDRERSASDVERRRVVVKPFFLSKYEMTTGQWRRIARSVPANQATADGTAFGDERPVVSISGEEAITQLHRLGCRLPDEFEWEYAARAGTDTPWWTGADAHTLGFVIVGTDERLLPAANLLDQSYVRSGAPVQEGRAVPWNDGFVATAPVGSLRPNAFGLFDVLGNAWEICSPHAGRRQEIAFAPSQRPFTVRWRGGGWNSHPGYARVTFSIQRNLASSQQNAGVRPARDLMRSPH